MVGCPPDQSNRNSEPEAPSSEMLLRARLLETLQAFPLCLRKRLGSPQLRSGQLPGNLLWPVGQVAPPGLLLWLFPFGL